MDRQIIAMQQWYQAPPGDLIAALECEQLARVLPNFFGQYALQLGGPPDLSLLQSSSIQQQYHVLPKVKCTQQLHSIEVDFSELPFAANSIDLVVIDHLLEYIEQPWQLLSQLYQCMAPHAHLVILSFTPWSLWGLNRLFRKKQGVPWTGQFWRVEKIQYWLDEIGYRTVDRKRFCYQGPLKCQRKPHVRTALEMVGEVCWAGFGTVYMIVAQKQISTMTPIKASWWAKKSQSSPCCAEPIACQSDRR